MRMSIGNTLIVSTLGLMLGGSAATAARPAPSEAPPPCGITWGSGEKAAGPLATAPVRSVRTERHACWDRVVFEFDGPAHGYSVRYDTRVQTDGEGRDLVPYTAGDAYLWVILRAPAYDADRASTIGARSGDHVANALPYDTLRDVVFGGSFEGYTTFAVGARARLPFRVTPLDGPGTHSRIAVDIAHRW